MGFYCGWRNLCLLFTLGDPQDAVVLATTDSRAVTRIHTMEQLLKDLLGKM